MKAPRFPSKEAPMSVTEAREATGHPVVVQPWDEHNQTLVANVHPPDWVTPILRPATTSWSSGPVPPGW